MIKSKVAIDKLQVIEFIKILKLGIGKWWKRGEREVRDELADGRLIRRIRSTFIKWVKGCKNRIVALLDWKRDVAILVNFWADLKTLLIPKEGNLIWRRVFKIAAKNLFAGRSRMMVTVGGVAVGIGAIVLLVSFGYGLQEVVTTRIIWPEALRVAEVSSESTSVKISKETIEKIRELDGVEKVAASIRLAGQVEFEGSKIDTVVVGATNDYLSLMDLRLKDGSKFSLEADKKYEGGKDIEEALKINELGMVAGVATEAATIKEGDTAEETYVWFRMRDGAYVPLRAKPRETGDLVGFGRGSLLDSFRADVVWGGVYEDVSGQGRVRVEGGKLMGKWLEAELPVWQDIDGVYIQERREDGEAKLENVYLNMADVEILSEIEKKIEIMLDEEGMILGETSSDEAGQSIDLVNDSAVSVGTEAATLVKQLSETVDVGDSQASELAISVWRENKKEILVSEALLRAWNKTADEIIGRELELQYLVTSTILPNLSGKVLSDKVKYQVIGVVEETAKPIVYTPLGDIESMGISNYSNLKVLAKDELVLPQVRSMIQTMGLVTKSVADTLSQIARLFTIIRFLLGSFGAIALIVALFGMFNTLTVSLLERTREIGVMKSLGTTNVDVTRIFLIEALLISFSGGFLGVLLGGFLGRLLDVLVFKGGQRLGASLFMLPIGFALFILLIAIVVGLGTGWYPAKRASKISALNALRYE